VGGCWVFVGFSNFVDFVYLFVIVICCLVFKLFGMKVEVIGVEYVFVSGGVVLVSNYVSYLDFIFVGLVGVEVKCFICFMVKDVVFKDCIGGLFMWGMYYILVDCDVGMVFFW